MFKHIKGLSFCVRNAVAKATLVVATAITTVYVAAPAAAQVTDLASAVAEYTPQDEMSSVYPIVGILLGLSALLFGIYMILNLAKRKRA